MTAKGELDFKFDKEIDGRDGVDHKDFIRYKESDRIVMKKLHLQIIYNV